MILIMMLIYVGGICYNKPTQQSLGIFTDAWQITLSGEDSLVVNISGQLYEFDLAKNRQFYLIAVKSEGEEAYVDIQ